MITQEELIENDVIVAELAENDIVSADVGAVSVATAGVSSWNGQKGDVTYTAPVTSVNGQTGDVVISSLDTYTKEETDALLSVKANSSDLASVATTGSYSDLSNKPTIPTVPTNVSAFTNDAGYLTQHQSLDGYATEQWVGEQGYITAAPVTSVNSKTGDVVLKTSDIQNDSGYITNAGVTSFNGTTGDVTYTAPVTSVNGQTGDVSLSIPTVPTNVSSFTNDAGYLTLSDLPIYQGGVE